MSSHSSKDWESDAPPAYHDAVNGHSASSSSSPNAFVATSQLQVQAIGYDANQAYIGKTLEQISVYRVDSGAVEYISLRPKRSSNSCALVRGSDSNHTPLISTIYRWGPGRSPRMRILPPRTSISVEDAIDADDVECELVEVQSRSIFSRSQRFDTSLGSFEWRYGSRTEREEAYNAASLLILERTDPVSSVDGKVGKRGVRVAQLVRNDEFRTPGTKKHMGGNGGRLMLNMSTWTDEKKTSTRDVEAFIVASCICMLKREADRFKDNEISILV